MQAVREPRVSIIMPFLNAERFMREAVESVAHQTDRDWELILVDDGSSDGSTAIAREYVGAEPARYVYLEHPEHANMGISAARNLALKHACGDFLMFLDADDVWLPGALERAVQLITKHDTVAMVMAPTLFWYSWDGTAEGAAKDRVDFADGNGLFGPVTVRPPGMLVEFLRRPGSLPSVCSVIIRKSVVEELGGFDDAFRGAYEDQVLFAKLALKHRIFIDDVCWARYRQQPESVSAAGQSTGSETDARRTYMAWLGEYLRSQGVTDESVWRAFALAALDQGKLGLLVGLRGGAWRRKSRSKARRLYERLPARARALAKARYRGRPYAPPPGTVRFGSLRRTEPLSLTFGFDRGLPVDRFYIEEFLEEHAPTIRGRVLEVGDDGYTRQFGGERVQRRDVLHVHHGNPLATFVDDLAVGDTLPNDAFDCLVLTQTLHLIYDFQAAVKTMQRILKPGGTALVTVPGITPLSHDEWAEGWYWAFTTQAMQRVFGDAFGAGQVEVAGYGNVLSAASFLYGLASEELAPAELLVRDAAYDVVVGVVATKALDASTASEPDGIGAG